MSGSVFLSFAHRFEIANALGEALEKVGDRLVSYKDEKASDKTIAAEMAKKLGVAVSEKNVANIRRELYGKIQTVAKPRPVSAVAALRDEVAGLAALAKETAAKVDLLRAAISTDYAKNARALGKLRDAVTQHSGSLAAIKAELRRAGCSDQEIANAMYISGARIKNGQTVELPQ